MKYNCKTEEYESPIEKQGIFKNPWVETGKKVIDDDSLNSEQHLMEISFHLRHQKSDETIETITTEKIYFGLKEDTLIENENGENEEIIAFLSRGGQYEKSKIRQWGRPSFLGVQQYFVPESIYGNLQLQTDNPVLYQIAKDWIDENVYIQGQKLGLNFELQINQEKKMISQKNSKLQSIKKS